MRSTLTARLSQCGKEGPARAPRMQRGVCARGGLGGSLSSDLVEASEWVCTTPRVGVLAESYTPAPRGAITVTVSLSVHVCGCPCGALLHWTPSGVRVPSGPRRRSTGKNASARALEQRRRARGGRHPGDGAEQGQGVEVGDHGQGGQDPQRAACRARRSEAGRACALAGHGVRTFAKTALWSDAPRAFMRTYYCA